MTTEEIKKAIRESGLELAPNVWNSPNELNGPCTVTCYEATCSAFSTDCNSTQCSDGCNSSLECLQRQSSTGGGGC
jgi:hypothetical protein